MIKVVISEYGKNKKIGSIAKEVNISEYDLFMLLQKANSSIQRHLRLKADVICCSDGHVRVKDIAGIIRLNNYIELEIVPKFLGVQKSNWKDDFLELLLLTNSGKILYSDHVTGGMKKNTSLYDTLAREFIRQFNENRKYYIRQYNKWEYFDFNIDGEIDFGNIFEKNADGIRQYSTRFDRKNVYNGVIVKAALLIREKVKNYDNINGLNNIVSFFGSQSDSIPAFKLPMKTRDIRWKELYDVSYEIVKNMSFTYMKTGVLFNAPGFVFSTWQIWQTVIEYALVNGLKDYLVKPQYTWNFGQREIMEADTEEIAVRPDITIMKKNTKSVCLLVDAKYKGRYVNDSFAVANADIYEAVAFGKASGCEKVILLYPETNTKCNELGKLNVFNRIDIQGTIIIGAKVDLTGIASAGGIKTFISTLATEIESYII